MSPTSNPPPHTEWALRDGASRELLEREPVLTPWLRTTILCLVIVVLMAGAGVLAGRLVGF